RSRVTSLPPRYGWRGYCVSFATIQIALRRRIPRAQLVGGAIHFEKHLFEPPALPFSCLLVEGCLGWVDTFSLEVYIVDQRIQVFGSLHYAGKLGGYVFAFIAFRRTVEDLIYSALGTHHEELCLSSHSVEQKFPQLCHLGRVKVFYEVCSAYPRTWGNWRPVEPGG